MLVGSTPPGDKAAMGTVHNFRRRPKNQGQFHGWQPKPPRDPRRQRPQKSRRRWWQWRWTGLALIAALAVGLGFVRSFAVSANAEAFLCPSATLVDGDTLRCGNRRVRLHGIDAPELPGHCRPGRQCTPGDPQASTDSLRRLVGAGPLQCRQLDTDAYGRTIARCTASGQDLSCAQLNGGHAVRRYGMLSC